MKIAIIGGGASGMTSAWLLNKKHDIHLYEKASILGGNIRTLNRNVKTNKIPENIYTENGVCFFPVALYPNFKKLMDILELELIRSTPKYAFIQNRKTVVDAARCAPLREELTQFIKYAFSLKNADLTGHPVSCFLKNYSSLTKQYLKNIIELTYSISCKYVDGIPAELAIPLLRGSLSCQESYFIKGGVYSYFEKMLETFNGKIFLNSTIKKIIRKINGVELFFDNGEMRCYDKIILATTPEQVLKLLADPTPAETRRFQNWKANRITTYAHTDPSIYVNARSVTSNFTNFFHEKENELTGYCTCMNRPYGITGNTPYFVTYNFGNEIAPERMLDVARHVTPFYDVEAIRYREEIKATDGESNTYYAGAWLYDGVHEGAITSAMTVSHLLGAKNILQKEFKPFSACA